MKCGAFQSLIPAFLLLAQVQHPSREDARRDLSGAQTLLAQCEARFGPDHPSVGVALDDMAKALSGLRRYYEAGPLIQRSVNILENARLPGPAAAARNTFGTLFFYLGDPEGAIRQFRRALAWLEAAGPSADRARILYNLAVAQLALGEYASARANLDASASLAEQHCLPDDPFLVFLRRARGRLPKRYR